MLWGMYNVYLLSPGDPDISGALVGGHAHFGVLGILAVVTGIAIERTTLSGRAKSVAGWFPRRSMAAAGHRLDGNDCTTVTDYGLPVGRTSGDLDEISRLGNYPGPVTSRGTSTVVNASRVFNASLPPNHTGDTFLVPRCVPSRNSAFWNRSFQSVRSGLVRCDSSTGFRSFTIQRTSKPIVRSERYSKNKRVVAKSGNTASYSQPSFVAATR